MVYSKRGISKKVLAFVLSVTCVLAFTPLMAFPQNANAASKFRVSPASAAVAAGKTTTLKANKKSTKWSSSDKTIAKITSKKGRTVKVKGAAPGKATIKATYKKKTKKITVTVTKAIDAPVVTGTAAVGQTLKARTAGTAAYQWYATDSDGNVTRIKSANSRTFTVTEKSVGYTLHCRARGTGYYTGSASSAETAKVVSDKKAVTALTITGTAKVGEILTATPDPAEATGRYVWFRVDSDGDRTVISDAADSTYTVQDKDCGCTIHAMMVGSGDYSNTIVSSNHTAIVEGSLEISSLEISDSSPVVGTTLSAELYPQDATSTYQWYRSSATGLNMAIVGAVDDTYSVTGADSGFKLYCVATGTGHYTGKVTSDQTRAVEDNTDWGANITDEDGYYVSYAHAGDTLYADIDAYAYATDFSFQWYKNGIMLANATGFSYTVPAAADAGAAYTVNITPEEGAGYGTADKTSDPVVICTDIGKGSITLSNTKPTTSDTVTAAVADAADADITGHCTIMWCLDDNSTSDSLICSDEHGTEVTGETFDCTGTSYYDEDGNAITLTGHALAPVAIGNYAYASRSGSPSGDYYCGHILGDATAAVTEKVASCTIEATNGNESGIGTIYTASANPAGATVTYQWYRSSTEGISTPIEGATDKTYIVTAADSGFKLYCVLKGTGSYSGEAASSRSGTIAKRNAEIEVTDANGIGLSTALAGDTLYATTVPKTAKDYVTYQWYKEAAAGNADPAADTKVGTDVKYTPTAAGTYYVTATLKTDGREIWSNGTDEFVSTNETEVTKKIDSVTLSVKDNALVPAATANTYVGYTVTASAAPETAATEGAAFAFYRDNTGTEIQAAGNDNTYTLKAADAGHRILCVVNGAGEYAGSRASAKTETVTYAIKSIEAGSPTIPQVGVSHAYECLVKDSAATANSVPDNAYTYTWSVNGTAVGIDNAAYKPVAADYGKALSVTVTGKTPYATGSATYTYEAGVANGVFAGLGGISDTATYAEGDTLAITTDPADAASTAAFQWYRSGKTASVEEAYNDSQLETPTATEAISGATGATYRLTGADVGRTVFCIVKNGKGYNAPVIPYIGTVNIVSE